MRARNSATDQRVSIRVVTIELYVVLLAFWAIEDVIDPFLEVWSDKSTDVESFLCTKASMDATVHILSFIEAKNRFQCSNPIVSLLPMFDSCLDNVLVVDEDRSTRDAYGSGCSVVSDESTRSSFQHFHEEASCLYSLSQVLDILKAWVPIYQHFACSCILGCLGIKTEGNGVIDAIIQVVVIAV